ncbi:pseudouridine synthase [Phlyctochytrium arcticum]|nr:pseudouridine synthase [Phlyctochytrium arcticum]
MSKSSARRWAKLAPPKNKDVAPSEPVEGGTDKDQEDPAKFEVVQQSILVPPEDHETRLDALLTKHLQIRRNIARLKILNHEVSIKGSAHARFADIAPDGIVHAGDTVVVLMQRRRKLAGRELERERVGQMDKWGDQLRARVLYKDAHVIAINKPHNLAVQGGSKVDTHLAALLETLQYEHREVPRLVHRLDRFTTGVLLLARTKSEQDSESSVSKSTPRIIKKYWALTHPGPYHSNQLDASSPPPPTSGTIVTGLVRKGQPGNERMTSIEWHDLDTHSTTDSPIRKAVTHFNVLGIKKQVALVELSPETGRKHQLRVHCADEMGSPIIGDYKYGDSSKKLYVQGIFKDVKHIPLQLHLKTIIVKDWFGAGADLEITAPLPDEMHSVVQKLGLDNPTVTEV